jgi:hypothetical protein
MTTYIKEDNSIEIVFYPDNSGYYNYEYESIDFENLKSLKNELKDKFNVDFVKKQHTPINYWVRGKKYYKINI